MSDELTTVERARLAALKTVIDRGMQSFIDVGQALGEIRDSRLYRESHRTFEAFCQQHWQMGRKYAYEVMQAARVAELVSGIPDAPAPQSTAVATELVPLAEKPAQLRETWQRAISVYGQQPTAKQVRELIRPGEPRRGREPEPAMRAAPRGNPEHDTRFGVIEDAVELLQLLPAPEQIVFPESEGDVEALDETIGWLAEWVPKLAREWRGHRQSLRQGVAA